MWKQFGKIIEFKKNNQYCETAEENKYLIIWQYIEPVRGVQCLLDIRTLNIVNSEM